MIGEGVSLYEPQILLHRSQLTAWRIVTQNYAIFDDPNATL